MSAVEIVALAGSLSLLSGWRLYATLFVAGLAMKFHVIDLPTHLASLDVLGNTWVLGVAGVGLIAEFFADKIAWVDSAWDWIHSIVRPLGGALLALAVVDPADPGVQVITFLLGGGAALLSHGVKSSTRAVVNASPEPVSNAVLSVGEDITTAGLAALALAYPVFAMILAVALLLASIIALFALRKIIRRIGTNMKKGPGYMLGLQDDAPATTPATATSVPSETPPTTP
jgi:hypothetical protein